MLKEQSVDWIATTKPVAGPSALIVAMNVAWKMLGTGSPRSDVGKVDRVKV